MLKTDMMVEYMNELRRYAKKRLSELEKYVGSDESILRERAWLEAFDSNLAFSNHDTMLDKKDAKTALVFELCGDQAENPVCQYAEFIYNDLLCSIDQQAKEGNPDTLKELNKRISDMRNMLFFIRNQFTATELSKTFASPRSVKVEEAIRFNKELQYITDPKYWDYLPLSVIEERLNSPEYYAIRCMANGKFNTKEDHDALEQHFLIPLVYSYMNYDADTYFSEKALKDFIKLVRKISTTQPMIEKANSEVYISFSYDKDLNLKHPVTFKLKFLRLSDGTYKLVADTQCGYIQYSDGRIDFVTEEGFFANDYFAKDEIFNKISVTQRRFERIFYFF